MGKGREGGMKRREGGKEGRRGGEFAGPMSNCFVRACSCSELSAWPSVSRKFIIGRCFCDIVYVENDVIPCVGRVHHLRCRPTERPN